MRTQLIAAILAIAPLSVLAGSFTLEMRLKSALDREGFAYTIQFDGRKLLLTKRGEETKAIEMEKEELEKINKAFRSVDRKRSKFTPR